MKNLSYKGYSGSIEFSHDDNLLFGKVLGVPGLISYEGVTGSELEADFRVAIDDYLNDCKESGVVPLKPFKGSFNVRISAELHQKAALIAMETKKSLNSFVAEAIRERVEFSS